MALRYSLEQIENWKDVCFIEASDDIPDAGVKKGQRIMNPVTDALIMATMGVGLGSIAEKNAAEFYARLSLGESLYGPHLIRPQEDGTRKPRPITAEEVRAHTGLSCNVSDESRTKWLQRIRRELDSRAKHYERAAAKELAA